MSVDGETTTGPRPRDAAATRKALLDAACRQFAHRGFAGASVREIAAAAGVDQALVYRYFGSKSALHSEVQQFYAQQLDDLFRLGEDNLASHVTAHLFSTPAGQHPEPLLALLHGTRSTSSTDPSLAHLLRDFVDTLAARLPADTPDARLRASLVGALTIGIPVLRDLLSDPALADAHPQQAAPHYAAAVRALLDADPREH